MTNVCKFLRTLLTNYVCNSACDSLQYIIIITSDQSNLTSDRIAATDWWFNRIRQVAPLCPPMWAHWHHLANTIELVLPSAHPSPQPKWQIDRFSRFCTAHGRKSLYLTMGDPFPKIAPFHADLDPHLICDFLGQSKPTVQTSSRSVQLFSHSWPQSVPTLQWAAHSPSILPLLMGELDLI